MRLLNSKEVGKLLSLDEKTVAVKARSLGIKRNSHVWKFSVLDVERIKNHKAKRFYNTAFSFSEDGKFLIINSKLNKQEV